MRHKPHKDLGDILASPSIHTRVTIDDRARLRELVHELHLDTISAVMRYLIRTYPLKSDQTGLVGELPPDE